MALRYPKIEEIIDFNKKILEKIKVKKKDKVGLMSYSKLVEIRDSCKTFFGIKDMLSWLGYKKDILNRKVYILIYTYK